MTRLRTIALTTLFLIPIAAAQARPGDWPVWRGPRRDGISEEKAAPVRLGPKEGILWKAVPPGEGHSTPIISGDALFLTAAVPAGGESRRVLLRYEKDTGRLVWEREVLKAPLEGKHRKNGYASGTPATDGERVYTVFCGNGRVQAAATLFDGNILWQASPCEFHSIHGFCISPILHKDLVILNCDQDSAEACIVALDRATGAVRWRTGRENHLRSYVTPFIALLAGRDQLLISGSKTVASFDPDTGRRIWVCDGPTEQCVATPVAGHGLVFITGGFPDREILAIRPDGVGDVTGTHILWRAKTGVSYVPSPLLVGDRFYVIRDEGGIACAYEARTGKLLWQERLGGDFSSSLTYAAGNIYAGSEDGILHIFAAEPRFRKVAAVEFGEGIFASPIFSDGRMVLRTTKTLYCFGDPGESPAAAPENDKDSKATGSSRGTARAPSASWASRRPARGPSWPGPWRARPWTGPSRTWTGSASGT